MGTRASKNGRRRLAVALLVFAFAAGTVGHARPASAAPPGSDPAGTGGFDWGSHDRATLTDGAARHPSSAAQAAPGSTVDKNGTGTYIVELAEAPVTTYPGGVAGLARTRPEPGKRLDANSAAAKAYRRHLDAQRGSVTAAAGVTAGEVYTTAFNGFSAKLTAKQVAALKADKRVRAVTAARVVATSAGTAGSTATSSAAADAKPAPPPSGSGTGAGVVIGVLDTGIWPTSPSFAKQMAAPAGWHGTCQTGVRFVAEFCNGKILGARYFADTYLASTGGALPDGEVLSPLDVEGHGTHTASTAAGLPVSNVTIAGRDFGSVSGVAPDAQIAVYKVLWGGYGYDGDIISAIDAAIGDGVQVLNYSIGVQFGDWDAKTPVGQAFLNATLAGIFVSAAAGNDGMTGSISNAAPWITTVGAAVTKADEGTLRLGDGTTLVGASLDPLPGGKGGPLVFGDQAGSLANGAAYCEPGSLDAAKVKGNVVACALEDPFSEAAEVKAKGAAAMLLFDPQGNIRVNYVYDFPVLYLNTAQQAGTLFNYVMRHPTDGTARLASGGDGSSLPGLPSVADFSSKGPNHVAPGVFKPDLVAPGADIVAAVSPVGDFGRQYDAYSGTSMAAPYVAGAAAVLSAEHPDWSPGALASALRTTATDTVGTTDPLYQGSGLVDLTRAADPGLVIEPDPADLVSFSQTAQPDGRELNLPSVLLHEYDGTAPVTVTRTLTNVGATPETYRASVSGLAGMQVTVTPGTVTVAPGKTATVTITLRRGSAPWDRYVTGAITWRGPVHSVRIPVAARPWGITPEPYGDEGEQFGRMASGAYGYLQPGFTGPLAGRSTGYTKMAWDSYSMPAGVDGGVFDPHAAGVQAHTFTVPANTAGIVVETTDDDPNTNLDLYLYKGDKLVYKSIWDWKSSEQAYVFLPEPGKYTAYVFARWSGGPVVNYRLGHVILSRTGKYLPATLNLPATVQRGMSSGFTLRPDAPLPEDGEYWAYTELYTKGQVIPGQLVSTDWSSWS